MLGIEFPELVVIAVVALIVIGPESLPKVARTMGHLWGRAQRYISGVKADISRDMALEEFRKLQEDARQSVANLDASMHQATQDLGNQIHEISNEISASKYDLGKPIPAQSMPTNEISAESLPGSELLKSESPRVDVAVHRNEIIDEHHAVMPASLEQKKSTNNG